MDPKNDDLQSSDSIDEMDFEIADTENLGDNPELESDPASEPEHEKKTDDDADANVNQDSVNKAINKQHAKYREEQRKRLELEKQNEELRQKYGAQINPEPTIPDIDYYASDVEEQVKKRDTAVREHAQWRQRQDQEQNEKQQLQRQSQERQQAEAQGRQEKFYAKAKELKISQQSLDKAIETVGSFSLGPQVAKYLMDDEKGVQMTSALSKNPALLADLSYMQPHEAILHIERNVRSRLKAVRSSNASKPPTRVSGKASAKSDQYPLTGGKVSVE